MNLVRVLLLAGFSTASATAQYSVSVERPCPMDTVTFTCTALGDALRWEPSDVTSITILSTSDLNVPIGVSGYTVTLIAANDTILTSNLSRTAKNGITVSCVGFVPTLNTIGSSTINLVDFPAPPSTVRHFTLSSSANKVSVPVQWDPPTETGGRDDLTYIVTVSPPAQLSTTVLTSTSVTMTSQYNVDYTVSFMAINCAGNSTTVEYNFRIEICPVLTTDPMNGAFETVTSRLPGSEVIVQCDAGFGSPNTMVTCNGQTLMWSPDPEAIVCSPIIQPPPSTRPPMRCTVQLGPPQNGTISDHSVPAVPATQVTFQCDNGLFPEGIMTATCLATGEWDKNPGEIICGGKSQPLTLFTRTDLGTAVSVSVVVTTALFTIIGFGLGLLIMYLFMRKKIVYLLAKKQTNVGPTVPAGPIYEEVLPKEEIKLNSNQAYGPVGL
ncbi:uncharacterized protein LOC135342941 [Halichondria panicea]|uniref:uncharacterized protein LOC135342941 n=1 Tax=Halichondria panicea TaxID=6063 RepID=UPI00312B8996